MSVPAAPTASAKRPLTTTERLESLKVTLAVVAGCGGLVALTVAYRRQRYNEVAEGRERVRSYTDRFVKAVEQLGHEQSRVRVAGVYAMAALADEWEDNRQMCIDVICAYVRMPYDPNGKAAKEGEREVRRTLFRVIRNHLRPDGYWGKTKWHEMRFSFEGATIDIGDLSEAHLAGGGHLQFSSVKFVGWFSLRGVNLNGTSAWFHRATFAPSSSVRFDGADFRGSAVDFSGAQFTSGCISFTGIRLDAKSNMSFGGARHLGGHVTWWTLCHL